MIKAKLDTSKRLVDKLERSMTTIESGIGLDGVFQIIEDRPENAFIACFSVITRLKSFKTSSFLAGLLCGVSLMAAPTTSKIEKLLDDLLLKKNKKES